MARRLIQTALRREAGKETQTMEINVRLNAALAQLAGMSRLQLVVEDGATVGDVRHQLGVRYPGLEQRLRHSVAMVGGVHAQADTPVRDGIEVAFLMPVAGGSIDLAR